MHSIHETAILSGSPIEITVVLQGLGHGDEITGPKEIETMMTITPEAMVEVSVPAPSTVMTLPENHIVDTAEGSGAPGCDETNECFLPYSLDVRVGDTVTWNNIDTAAHTVTSGSGADGADGLFDSSLFMSGTSFEVIFDETGTFDYFCMVHPWMTGMVVVNEVVEDIEVVELIDLELQVISESLPITVSVSVPAGSAIPGCDETDECYIPYEVTIASGSTVSWINDDSAAHTVTSGTATAGQTGVFDSGIFMLGTTFEFTFDDAGTFDYFCMVHPWMTGQVIVN
jgi:plastocyanin